MRGWITKVAFCAFLALLLAPIAFGSCVQGKRSEYGGVCCSLVAGSDVQATISVKQHAVGAGGSLVAYIGVGPPSGQWIQEGLMLSGGLPGESYSEVQRAGQPDSVTQIGASGSVHVELRRVGGSWEAFLNTHLVGKLAAGSGLPVQVVVESQGDCSDSGVFVFRDVLVDGRAVSGSSLLDPGFALAAIDGGFVVSASPRAS